MIDYLMHLSPGVWVALVTLTFIGLVSQISLYAKAGQPAVSALVPVWNVLVFCKVVGRPIKHALFLIVPGVVILLVFGIYFQEFNAHFPSYDDVTGQQVLGQGTIGDLVVPLTIIGLCMIPIGIMMVFMFIEVCDSFGKHSTTDKVLCVIFNGVYVLFVLGVSQALYEAPWWRKKRGLPYFVPHHKSRDKIVLIIPEGPIVGNSKDQKVKKRIMDRVIAEKLDPETAAKQDVTELSKKEPVEKIVKSKSTEKVKTQISEPNTVEKSEVLPDNKLNFKGKKSVSEVGEMFKKSDPKTKPKTPRNNWQDELKAKYKKKK